MTETNENVNRKPREQKKRVLQQEQEPNFKQLVYSCLCKFDRKSYTHIQARQPGLYTVSDIIGYACLPRSQVVGIQMCKIQSGLFSDQTREEEGVQQSFIWGLNFGASSQERKTLYTRTETQTIDRLRSVFAREPKISFRAVFKLCQDLSVCLFVRVIVVVVFQLRLIIYAAMFTSLTFCSKTRHVLRAIIRKRKRDSGGSMGGSTFRIIERKRENQTY